MRLQFQLNKIKIDPICHVQILRHADEFHPKPNIYGQLYGALYDDEAEVTTILPFPDGEKSTREELEAMEKRNDESLSAFSLDTEKIGWYMICYKRNFWENLETIKYYENYINTSFFLVFDYKARETGLSPYKAYRLKDEFALKDNFKWQDLQKCNLETDNPFFQIPVEVRKNQLFELLMLENKKDLLANFQAVRVKKQHHQNQSMKENIDEYVEAFEEREDIQNLFNELLKSSESHQGSNDKPIPYSDYTQYIGQAFKLESYESYFKEYQKDFEKVSLLFEAESN